jgi:hypothetical protein
MLAAAPWGAAAVGQQREPPGHKPGGFFYCGTIKMTRNYHSMEIFFQL